MKKILSLVLSLILVLTMSFPVMATDTSVDYNTAYSWAVNAGFPVEFLDSIDEDFLYKIYNENIDVPELEVTYDVNYYCFDDTPQTNG